MKKVVLIAVGLLIVVMMLARRDDAGTGTSAQVALPKATLGAADIDRAIETYRTNEPRFKRDYVGRGIEFVSTFQRAKESTFSSDIQVTIDSDRLSGNAYCFMSPQETAHMIDWRRGQPVRVYGVIRDSVLGSLALEHCKIDAWQ